jgi:hypothetical protein
MAIMTKALILLALLVAVPAAGALAQAGYIGLYADEAGTACSVADPGGGQVNVYVIHQAVSGAAASQWRIAPGAGFAMTYLGESSPVVAMGDTQSGVSASYGSCLASPILLATVTYLSHGTSASCSYLDVIADPASSTGTIEVVDCSSVRLTGVGSRLYVNPDESCPCGQANPTRDTDWGRIKAMYAN